MTNGPGFHLTRVYHVFFKVLKIDLPLLSTIDCYLYICFLI